MTVSPTRLLSVVALLGGAALAIALLSQHVWGMRPCAWCVLQRLILLGIIAAALAGVVLARRQAMLRAAAALTALLCVAGIASASYQYSVAAQQFSCAQTFADRFMTQSGLDAALPWLFGIYATCMDARVNLFGIEYALWALGLFGVLCGLSLWAAGRKVQQL